MTDGAFDADVAARYDRDVAERFDAQHLATTVDRLVELADGRPILEFAIGTGRIALPLAARGVEVHGIELSTAMVAEMRKKPGADGIPVTIGDMASERVASTRVDGAFGLVLLVFNTITNLLTQAEQVACFRNAAAHLVPGGHFLIETGIPRVQRLPVGERFLPFEVAAGHIGIDEYDLAEQRSVSHHYWITDGDAATFESHHRYAWPAEYDLMAHIADMTLSSRWADWDRSPFTSDSEAHVSVWTTPS
jgi:SAM-dependent methyltransferase